MSRNGRTSQAAKAKIGRYKLKHTPQGQKEKRTERHKKNHPNDLTEHVNPQHGKKFKIRTMRDIHPTKLGHKKYTTFWITPNICT